MNPEPKQPKSDKQLQETTKPKESTLTQLKMDARSPIQDFVYLSEHQELFEKLWKKST